MRDRSGNMQSADVRFWTDPCQPRRTGTSGKNSRRRSRLWCGPTALGLVLLAAWVGLSGCQSARQVRDPHYAQVIQDSRQASYSPAAEVEAVNPVVEELAGPHPLDDYVRYALAQNPEIQAARKRIDALSYQVPVASALPDPLLNMTAFPEPIQTAAGQQEFSLSASQKLPWRRKLERQAAVVQARADASRAELAAVELGTVAKVKKAYYELYFLQQAIEITEEELDLLGQIRNVADTRYRTGQTSQQDVLRADLEISNVENELIRLRRQLTGARARLASLLHVSPQTPLAALRELPEEQLPQDLAQLQRRAVAARPELHAKLAALASQRHKVDLARLEYVPDVTVGASWIAISEAGISPVSNGEDAVLLNLGMNLPLYRKRLDMSVRSAEAGAVATAREYDALRDATQEEVVDLFAQAQSEQQLIELFRNDILPQARQTLEVSSRAYNVGETDFLQLIDNWRELLRYEVGYRRLEASLRQTLADLERVVGGFAETPFALEGAPEAPAPAPQSQTL